MSNNLSSDLGGVVLGGIFFLGGVTVGVASTGTTFLVDFSQRPNAWQDRGDIKTRSIPAHSASRPSPLNPTLSDRDMTCNV
eukprot:1930076-Pyramimonas_sp.AAC.1